MQESDRLIGRQLANFRIDRVLGRGGMATVYYGWDVRLERPVAVKVIDASQQPDPAYAERFVNEARAMAAWHHPNILQVYYAGEEDGLYYFAMEYIPGKDLARILADQRKIGGRLPDAEVARFGSAVARALDYAHERGVIHRDVKPANVIVAEEGRVVLADFGLALNVARGTLGEVFGSPHYMAPEQARNSSQAVPQSDLYSLGVMLFELLAGQVPFDDPSPASLAVMHITQPPPSPRQFNPGLSAAVEAVLLKALRKQPEDRYQTGEELMEALERALDVPEPTLAYLDDRETSGQPAGPDLEPALRRLRAIGRATQRRAARAWAAGLVAGRAALRGAGRAARAGQAQLQRWRETPPANETPTRPKAQQPVAAAAPPAAALTRPATWWLVVGVSVLLLAPTLWARASAVWAERSPGDGASPEPTAEQAAPTAAAEGEATAPPTEPTAGPPAAGDLFALYYDDTGFYFQNMTDRDRSLFPVAFERLDESGNPLNRFDGSRWGQFYGTARAGYCAVVEIIDYRHHLDPKSCRRKHIVIRTPNADDPTLFFTTLAGSQEFRVLWDNHEVGRCSIAAQYCEVLLP
jgi:hypothetical protein